MQNKYEVRMSADGTYVHVRVKEQFITLELAAEFTRELTQLGETSEVYRCLIDIRGARSQNRVLGEYQYAYEAARSSGLTHTWRMAVLKDQADTTHDFLQTVMENAGWAFALFNDENEAIHWLNQGNSSARDTYSA